MPDEGEYEDKIKRPCNSKVSIKAAITSIQKNLFIHFMAG